MEQTTNDDLNDHAVERAMRSDAERIAEECDALKAMLLEKNRNYGSSALNPVRIFSKADAVDALRVRIDDKLSRLIHGRAAGEDVVKDLLGYLILLRIATKEQQPSPLLCNQHGGCGFMSDCAECRSAGGIPEEFLKAAREAPSIVDVLSDPNGPAAQVLFPAMTYRRPEPREDVGFALTDAEAVEAERAVDEEWGGAIRRKLGVARGMLEEALEREEDFNDGVGDWVRKLKETLAETADSSPPPQSDDLARLVQQRDALWALLDNIDTLDDTCRDNDRTFRNMVRRWQRTRFDIFNPDNAKPSPGRSAPHATMQDKLEQMRGRLAVLRERIVPLQRDSDALREAYEAAGISDLMNLAGHIRALKILVADRNDLKQSLAAARSAFAEEAERRQREALAAMRKIAEAEEVIALMQSLAARRFDAEPGTGEGE